MALRIRLLGKPSLERGGDAVAGPRGRKAWALLAYLLLSGTRPTRGRLAELLFSEADDPLGALRWSLAELRRALELPESLTGEQPRLELEDGTWVDALAVTAADGGDAVDLAELGGELLEGMDFSSSPAFESWLLVERHHLAAASEALLHEAAMARLGEGMPDEAARLAARLVALNPLEEANQELLVRSLARGGDHEAASAQAEACRELFERELGTEPSPAIRRAARPPASAPPSDRVAARAALEAGQAQVAAGAVEPGLDYLRQASALANGGNDPELEARALVALGSALIHSVRGRDEEGAVIVHEALAVADREDIRATAVFALRELGFVEMLAGRRERAEAWLAQARRRAEGDAELGPVLTVSGISRSDMGDYPAALELLEEGARRSESCGEGAKAAFGYAWLARARLLRGELDAASTAVDRSLELVEIERWLAFRPWPETIRAEIDLREGRVDAANERLEHAFALACQVADPCWEGLSARVLGLVAVERGQPDAGRDWLEQARTRCTRVSDAYEWAHGHILDALTGLAVDTGDEAARALVDSLSEHAGRGSMNELAARALIHRARLDTPEALVSARELAAEIENPELDRLLASA